MEEKKLTRKSIIDYLMSQRSCASRWAISQGSGLRVETIKNLEEGKGNLESLFALLDYYEKHE